MRTALDGVDVVCKGQKALVIAVIVLQRNLCHPVLALRAHVNDLGVYHLADLLLVDILNEGANTALVFEIVLSVAAVLEHLSLVAQTDVYTTVEECLLTQTLEQRIIIKHDLLEHIGIRLEAHVKTVAIGFSLFAERTRHVTSFKSLGITSALMAVIDLHPLRECIYDRRTNTVQTARILISVTAEFSARVKNRVNDLQRRNTHLRMNAAGDTATVVLHRHAVVGMQRDLNALAATRQCLVDRVIDDLVYQMVKSARRSRPDIHTRSLSHGLQTLQYLNLAFVVDALFKILHDCHRKSLFTSSFGFPLSRIPDRRCRGFRYFQQLFFNFSL